MRGNTAKVLHLEEAQRLRDARIEQEARIAEIERTVEFMMEMFNPTQMKSVEATHAVIDITNKLITRRNELKGDNNETK